MFLFLMFLSSIFVHADEIELVARLNPSRVGVRQSFLLEVEIRVQSSRELDVGDPELPDLPYLHLLGQSQSQQFMTQLKQGLSGPEFLTTKTYRFLYRFSAQKKGEWVISGIKVRVGGKIYQADPVKLFVVEGQSPNLLQPGDYEDEELDDIEKIFRQVLRRHGLLPDSQSLGQNHGPQKEVNPPSMQDAFFIHLDADKTEAYVGEQISVAWYLYTRANILSLDRLKFPDLKGFWKEVIEEVPTLQFVPETIRGVVYRKALLAAHALFPMRPGVAVIDEYKIKATVQNLSSTFGLGFGNPYTYQKSSPRLSIQVKELPKVGQPASFTGGVGEFIVEGELPLNRVAAGQPFPLKVKISGRGNAKFVELSHLKWPEGWKVVHEKSDSKFFRNGTSVKDLEILFSIQTVGEHSFPDIRLGFFSPDSGQYYERELKFGPITVDGVWTPGNQESEIAPESSLDQELKLPQWDSPRKSGFLQILGHKFAVAIPALVVLSLGYTLFGIVQLYLFRRSTSLWIQFLESRMKKLKKSFVSRSIASHKIAHEMNLILSQIVGIISREGDSSLPLDKLLQRTPPAFQNRWSNHCLKLESQLSKWAYGPDREEEASLTLLRDPFRDLELLLQDVKVRVKNDQFIN